MELIVKPTCNGSVFLLEFDIMIEGRCYKCNRVYFGWALLEPRNQACPQCGAGLLITEDGKETIHGYSPFTAEEYKIKLPPQIISDPERTKDSTANE
jgi:hypothetical protein